MSSHYFKSFIIVAIIIAIVGISLAYAGLSQTLNIKTTTSVQSQTTSWNVHFATADSGTSTNADKGTISLTNTTVTINGVVLKAPGASVTYTFYVKNDGQVPAQLNTLTRLTPSLSGTGTTATSDATIVQQNYSCSLTQANGSAFSEGYKLNSGSSVQLKLVISYSADTSSLPIGDVVVSNLGYTLNFVQA